MWDEQRREWFEQNPSSPGLTARGKPRMLLLSGAQPTPCEKQRGDYLLLKSVKNKIDYCRLHNIDFFYNTAHLDRKMSGFWAKLPLVRRLMLGNPEVEWIWWMDSDALFTDMAFEIPIGRYDDYNLVLHGFKELVYHQRNWVGLNTGIFLIRNCQWSLDLLDAWASLGPKGPVREKAGNLLNSTLKDRANFEADDQSALIDLLTAEDTHHWSDKVFLEDSYDLHGNWVKLVGKYKQMMDHPGELGTNRWPFVTHFMGCKPCGNYADYPVAECMHHMDRAFNFANNQILGRYGFRYSSLEASDLMPMRNDTSDPLQPEYRSLPAKP